jgi:hypothetical protein
MSDRQIDFALQHRSHSLEFCNAREENPQSHANVFVSDVSRIMATGAGTIRVTKKMLVV